MHTLVVLRKKLNKRRSNIDFIYLKLVHLFQLEDVTSSVCERESLSSICSVSNMNITPPHECSTVIHPLRHNSKLAKKCVHERIDPTESEHDGTQVLHSSKSFNDSSTLWLELVDL